MRVRGQKAMLSNRASQQAKGMARKYNISHPPLGRSLFIPSVHPSFIPFFLPFFLFLFFFENQIRRKTKDVKEGERKLPSAGLLPKRLQWLELLKGKPGTWSSMWVSRREMEAEVLGPPAFPGASAGIYIRSRSRQDLNP